MNKKAQGMSVNTIILIILGLVVLVILILGFTVGWGQIKDWIIPSNNVQDIVDQCTLACSLDNKFDFCTVKREVKMKKDLAEGIGIDLDTGYTCNELVAFSDLGISECVRLCDEDLENCVPLGGHLIAEDETCLEGESVIGSNDAPTDGSKGSLCCKASL